jgi:HD-GYP domain-containing protein (c-di-GMP phosphodiesterase class II)
MRQRIRLTGVSREIEGQTWQGVDQVRIGRDPQGEVALTDTSISRCHAEGMFVEPLGWFIRDLGSVNGTYLNGVRVGAQERRLRERDLIQVGNLVLRVAALEETDGVTLAGFSGTVEAGDNRQQSWEEAFGAVARHMSQHSCNGSQLLGLLRAGHALHHTSSIDELLKKSLDDAVRMLNARHGALLLVDERSGKLTVRAATIDGFGKQPAPCLSKTLVQRCMSRGESLLCPDVRDDEELRRAASVARGNMQSVICALLRSPQRRLGLLHLDRGPDDMPFSFVDLHVADALAASIAGSIENAQFFLARQRTWFIQTVITLAQTIELRDPSTAGHAERVTRYALLLAEALKLPGHVRRQIETGGRLHDIGKIGIRDAVLRKEGRLSNEEYEHMKSHTVKGAAILAAIPDLGPVLPIIRNHHERWDGRGYPDRLAGQDIPLVSRLVAVADSFDAMTSNRPYRSSLPIDEAFDQLRRGAGTQFDPECSRAFLGLRTRLTRMLEPGRHAPSSKCGPAVECEALAL